MVTVGRGKIFDSCGKVEVIDPHQGSEYQIPTPDEVDDSLEHREKKRLEAENAENKAVSQLTLQLLPEVTKEIRRIILSHERPLNLLFDVWLYCAGSASCKVTDVSSHRLFSLVVKNVLHHLCKGFEEAGWNVSTEYSEQEDSAVLALHGPNNTMHPLYKRIGKL